MIGLREREIWIEPQRGLELGERVVEAPHEQVHAAERVMRPGILAVGEDRSAGRTLRLGRRDGHVRPAHVDAERVARRKHAERLAVVGVDRGRLLQQRLGHHLILAGHPPVMRQRAHHQVPGIQAVRRLAPGAEILRRIELRLDRGDDGLGDLVLDREHVGELAVVALRPDVAAGRHVIELRGDAHAVAAFAHAAFDHVADAELLRDLSDVHRLALVSERRVARDHEEPAQLGERRDDVLADAVGEILLLRLPAHVDERKHGEGRTVGQRQWLSRRCAGLLRRDVGRSRVRSLRLRVHSPDETQALARDGANQPLLVPAVADRLACGIDAAGQRRIRYDAAAPDGGYQVVLADDPVAVLHQIDQEVEHLRLDRDRHGAAIELPAIDIKDMVGKQELHESPRGQCGHADLRRQSRRSQEQIKLRARSFGRTRGILRDQPPHRKANPWADS